MYLSIIIPAFEEAQKIKIDIEEALYFLNSNLLNGEIIIVDDGSTDDTSRIVHDKLFRIFETFCFLDILFLFAALTDNKHHLSFLFISVVPISLDRIYNSMNSACYIPLSVP